MTNIPPLTPQGSKLLILYFFDTVNTQLTKLQLNDAFTELELLSYFELMEYLEELLSSGMIKERVVPKGEFLLITQKGKAALAELKADIRHSQKIKIDEYCKANIARIEAEQDFKADYYKIADNEFRVMLKIYEEDSCVFEVNLKIYSETDARNIAKKWRSGAPDIYRTVFSMLT